MSLRLSILLGGSLVCSLVALAVAGPAAASLSCGSVKGPKWSILGKSGTHYTVYAAGVPCSTARAYVAKFVKLKTATAARAHPAGYTCSFIGSLAKASTGSCRKGARTFFWVPSLP
jgi:hypothetical protein